MNRFQRHSRATTSQVCSANSFMDFPIPQTLEDSLPEPSRNEEPALMAHWAPERVTAPQRAGDALSKRNGMDPDAFTTSLGPKRGNNSMRLRVTHRRSGLDQGSSNAHSIPRAGTKAKW